jgi:hypothetical protein
MMATKTKMTSKDENISPFLEEDPQENEQWECDDVSDSSSISSVLSSLTGTLSRAARKQPIKGIKEEKADDVEQGSDDPLASERTVLPSTDASRTSSGGGGKNMVTIMAKDTIDGSQPNKASQIKRSRRRYLILGVVLLIVVSCIVTISVVLSQGSGSQGNEAVEDDADAKLSPREKALLAIFNTVSTEGLHQFGTPQDKAREYIVYSDALKLTPSELVSDSRIAQRYALAVFYFSTNGMESWAENNWLFGDECENTFWTGISCNDDGQVRAISFGTCSTFLRVRSSCCHTQSH